MENESVEESKLTKAMSAVSFQESTVVYNIDRDESPQLHNGASWILSSANKAEKGQLFRTILKRSLPKIKCLSTFTTLHENIQNQNKLLENQQREGITLRIDEDVLPRVEEMPVEIVNSRSNSGIKSGQKRPSKLKRPKTCISLPSSLTSSATGMYPKSDLVKSFVNTGKKVHNESQKKTKKSQKEGKKKKKVKREICDPVIINTRVNYHENVTPGTLECLKLHQTLAANGVRISVETLKRALLPPSEIRIERYEMNQTRLPVDSCSRLLSHPSAWLPKEYARLRSAKKRLEEFEEETIRQTTVITSDDEDSESSDESPKKSTNSSRLYYNAFARTANSFIVASKLRGSIKDVPVTPSNTENPSEINKNVKVISKWKSIRRPSTAG